MTDMQIKEKNTLFSSSQVLGNEKSGHTDFAAILDSSLSKMNQSKNPAESNHPVRERATDAKPDLIKLGNITPSRPTVSHLSINHPEYGRECWEIIHSDLNKNKPFNRIPAGTDIYIDPESKEIIWDYTNDGQKGIRGIVSPSALEATRAVPKSEMHHFSRAKVLNNGLSGQKIKNYERHLIDQSVSRAAKKYSVPQELIMGVIKAESDFQVRAISPAGAQGLMQLMPATARELGVKNPFDIRENIEGGVKYLRKMIDTFKGNLIQALAAYNAGPQAVKNHQGKIPFQETRTYVKRVLSFFNHFK